MCIRDSFDIDNSPVDNTGIPTIDIVDQEDNENFANIPTLDQETPYVFEDSQETIEMLDSGTIQDFETYDPNASMRNQMRNANIEQRTNSKGKSYQKSKKSLVPSDSYDVDISRLTNVNRKNETSKSFFSSSVNVFEHSIDLSLIHI